MTLDEQITILEHNAEYERTHGNLQGCLNFRQLVKWLKDYKRLLSAQKVIRCKDCKYLWECGSYSLCDRTIYNFPVEKDGFCAWAKMKEGDTE